MPPGVAFDLVEGTVPGSGALLQLAAAAPVGRGRPAGHGAARRRVASPPPPTPASALGRGRRRRGRVGRADGVLAARGRRPAPVLRFDDGMVVTVDEDLVLGRRPDNHELVTGGTARPVPIADTQNVLSSAHAAIQRTAARSRWSTSARSTARTSPAPRPPSGPSSSPASPHPLSDGDRLLLGWTVITFEQPPE